MKMIQKLKRKLLYIIMLFITFIIVTLIIAINIVPFQQLNTSAYSYLYNQADDTPEKPSSKPKSKEKQPEATPPQKKEKAEVSGQSNIFSSSNVVIIELDNSKNIISWKSDKSDLFDDEYIADISPRILNSSKEFGIKDGRYYLYLSKPDGYKILLLDSTALLMNKTFTFFCSLIVGIILWIFAAIISVYLIKLLTKPLVIAFENQQQFISDAEHELKTPISVIASNADVLHAEIGDNPWLSHIISETKRMSNLVHEMLSLSMLSDTQNTFSHADFNISETLMEVILPFESVAYEKGITIEFDIAQNLICHGDVEQIKQLIAILIQNAIKYSNINGHIHTTLSYCHKKAVLKIYNTGDGIAPEDIDKIFDRFYRVNKDRNSSSGGHGLGLSIAKSIAEKNNGTISVTSHYKQWAEFEVQFPCTNSK